MNPLLAIICSIVAVSLLQGETTTALPVLDCERCKEFDLMDEEHSLCSFGCSYYVKTTLPGTADNADFEQLAQKLLPILRFMRQFHPSMANNPDPFAGLQLNHETMEFEPLSSDVPEEFDSASDLELVLTPEITVESEVEEAGPILPDSTEELEEDFIRLLSLNPQDEVINFEDDDNTDGNGASAAVLLEDQVVGGQKSSRVDKDDDDDDDDDDDIHTLEEILGLSLTANPKVSTTGRPVLRPTEVKSSHDEESDDVNEIPDERIHPLNKNQVVKSNDVFDALHGQPWNHVPKRFKKIVRI